VVDQEKIDVLQAELRKTGESVERKREEREEKKRTSLLKRFLC